MTSQPLRIICYIIFALVVGSIAFTPVFHRLNTVEPMVFGMPFIMFWLLTVNVVATVALFCLTYIEDRREG